MTKYSKESLEKLLVLIDDICKDEENLWFKDALQSKINDVVIENPNSTVLEIKKDTTKIVGLLNLKPSISIDYSFINYKLLRTRLELDNLRMENIRYDLIEKDEMKRLYDYCINAFYQIENLLNYFYYEKYPKPENLFEHLENIKDSTFKRKKENNVGDIAISVKIYSFNKTYYVDDYTGYNIDSLRLIRNEGVHRCTRIKNIENEHKRLHEFLKYATFNSVRILVKSLTQTIKDNLQK